MIRGRWVGQFATWARRQGARPRTLKNYATYAHLFEGYLAERGVDDPRDATRELIADFQGYLAAFACQRGRPYSTSSRAHILSWLKKVYGFFIQEQQLLVDPTRGLRLPRIRRPLPRGLLTAAEMRRLLAAPDTTTPAGVRDRALLEVLYGTGLRFSELADLRVADVDLVDRVLWVRGGKGEKDRVLPLGRWATHWLGRYLEGSDRERRRRGIDRVFLAARADRLSSWVLITRLRALANIAGIPKALTVHGLRHTFATVLIKGGADIRQIQKLMGHGDLTSTQLYTHLDLADLRRVQQRCHPREKQRGTVRRG